MVAGPVLLVYLSHASGARGRLGAFASCSVYYQKEQNRLFCPCHEGVFDTRTGEPVAGPPVRPLSRITLQTNAEKLYAIGVEP